MEARYGLNQGFQIYDDAGELIRLSAAEILFKSTEWLKNNKDEPFFLFIHFFDPHTPYYSPEHFRTKFGAPDKAVPPAIEFVPDPSLFTPTLVHETIAAYDATIAYADWAVGKLMQELDQLSLNERTLVVLVSDHGETLDELATRYGYFFDHGEFLYVHQLQIPLIIRTPETVTSGNEIVHTDPVSITDVMPTILEELEIELPRSMAGLSLLPMLHGEKVSHGPVFSERRAFGKAPKPYMRGDDYSIIEGPWHLIFSTVRDNELYNLLDDPGEISNLQHKPDRSKTLKGKLYKWLDKVEPLFGPPMFETDEEALRRLRTLGYVG
jgi:arylsulfatase A-like enzyme